MAWKLREGGCDTLPALRHLVSGRPVLQLQEGMMPDMAARTAATPWASGVPPAPPSSPRPSSSLSFRSSAVPDFSVACLCAAPARPVIEHSLPAGSVCDAPSFLFSWPCNVLLFPSLSFPWVRYASRPLAGLLAPFASSIVLFPLWVSLLAFLGLHCGADWNSAPPRAFLFVGVGG